MLADLWSSCDPLVAKEAAAHVATCRRGCSACCSQLILVWQEEARVIARTLPATWVERLADASVPYCQPDFDRDRHFAANIPCVFLQAGECCIYPVRPVVCRYCYVASDPFSCRPGDVGLVSLLRFPTVMARFVSAVGHGRLQDRPLPLAVLAEMPGGKARRALTRLGASAASFEAPAGWAERHGIDHG